MKQLYFAAPLFSDAERTHNARTVNLIEQLCPVFLPQRDGHLVTELVAQGMSVEDAFEEIRRADINAIRESSLIVCVLDGASIDEGVAFEIGYAFALGKTCIGYQTDFRRAIYGRNNPIIERALKSIATGEASLIRIIMEELQRLPSR
jgi:nucleoside 2-deoxyribosyltransferase